MRNSKGQFIKGFNPLIHNNLCTCFRCTRIVWNKGKTGYRIKAIPWSEERKASIKTIKINIICKHCKNKILDFPSNKRVYCSRSCRGKYLSIHNRGENAYHYQGGIVKGNRHRARKNGKEDYYTFQEWEDLKKFYGYMCLCCKRIEPEISLTADHIIPISRGGNNSIDNIQPLCMKCNKEKFTKTTNYKIDFSGRAVA